MRPSIDSLMLSRFLPRRVDARVAFKRPISYSTSRRDGFVFAFAPRSKAALRYREIRDRILAAPGRNKLMLITSAAPEDGKTITSVNLAFALAEKKKSVFLLELSLARPRFQHAFGVPPYQVGVESVLRGEAGPEEIIGQLGESGIAIAGVTSLAADNALLAPSEHLDRLLSYSEANYDWTIVDAPDVMSCPHAATLAAKADRVILVLRARQTQLRSLRHAVRVLGDRLSSVIMNDSSI